MKISRTCIDVYVEGATCVGEPRAGESLHVQESLGVRESLRLSLIHI